MNDNCYFIARQNPLYGQQLVVSDEGKELFLIKHLLKGEKTDGDLYISTSNSHRLTHIRQNCLPHLCKTTIYVNQCNCQLNALETFGEKIAYFYDNFTELFWIVVSVTIIVLMFCLLRCVLCSCRQNRNRACASGAFRN